MISNYCKDFYSRLKWFSFKIFCFWNRSKISPEFGWFNYSGLCLAPTRIFSSASILPFQDIRERKKNPTCQEIMPKSSYIYIFRIFNNSSSNCSIILITWTQFIQDQNETFNKIIFFEKIMAISKFREFCLTLCVLYSFGQWNISLFLFL